MSIVPFNYINEKNKHNMINKKISPIILATLINAGCDYTLEISQENPMVLPGENITELNADKVLSHARELQIGNAVTNNSVAVGLLADKMYENGASKLAQMTDNFSSGEIFTGMMLVGVNGGVDDINLRDTFLNLVQMSIMVSLPPTDSFSNPDYKSPTVIAKINEALVALLNKYYFIGSQHTGNWWNWEIGVNKSLIDIIAILKDDLPSETTQKALEVSKYMAPDPFYIFNSLGTEDNRVTEISLGANRIDLAWLSMVRAALENDDKGYQHAIKSLYDLFEIVNIGDGVYADGSIIQHVDIPYIGGYGSILLEGYSEIFYVLSKSGFKLNAQHVDFVYDMIFSSFAPVLFKSQILEGFRGRGSSRGWIRGRKEAEGIIQSLIILYDIAPTKYKAQLGELIKGHLLSPAEGKDAYLIQQYANKLLPLYIAESSILADSDISIGKDLVGNYLFYNSDRVVHRTHNWVLSISAYSNRVGNYECINGENLLGYNTSNGMMYIYDQDQEQYVNYWPMMDPQLPAGTTNNISFVPEPCSQILSGPTIDKNLTWVGGVSTRAPNVNELSYGTFGMDFINHDDTVAIKKSWFFFDKEIVFIGSDLNPEAISADGFTSVDFRKIKSSAGNRITIDGKVRPVGATPLSETGQFKWIHIEGDLVAAGRGYIFEPGQDIILQRSIEVEKSWVAVNEFNETRLTNPIVKYNLITVDLEHKTNNFYSYVLLPSSELPVVKAYVEAPTIEVIQKTEQAHVVKHNTLEITAANIWDEAGFDGADFIIDGSASLMFQVKDNIAYVWISNPNGNEKTVELTLPALSATSEITSQDADLIKTLGHNHFSIDFKKGDGSTIAFSFEL